MRKHLSIRTREIVPGVIRWIAFEVKANSIILYMDNRNIIRIQIFDMYGYERRQSQLPQYSYEGSGFEQFIGSTFLGYQTSYFQTCEFSQVFGSSPDWSGISRARFSLITTSGHIHFVAEVGMPDCHIEITAPRDST